MTTSYHVLELYLGTSSIIYYVPVVSDWYSLDFFYFKDISVNSPAIQVKYHL